MCFILPFNIKIYFTACLQTGVIFCVLLFLMFIAAKKVKLDFLLRNVMYFRNGVLRKNCIPTLFLYVSSHALRYQIIKFQRRAKSFAWKKSINVKFYVLFTCTRYLISNVRFVCSNFTDRKKQIRMKLFRYSMILHVVYFL